MSVISVDPRSRKPIWEQLTENIKLLVLRGILKPDEQLPGVRTLAGELAINPNTIQKSYAELERQGIIYSIQGRGCFVTDNRQSIENEHKKALEEKFSKIVSDAKESRIDKERLCALIENIYSESES